MGAATPIIAGAGLLSSVIQGQQAQKSADKAASSQKEIAKRITKLFDTMYGVAQDADKAGTFDPDKQIAQLEKDTARYESQDMGNAAGAARVMGYQPGDSAVSDILSSVKEKYRATLDNARAAMRTNSVFQKVQAYGAANAANLGGAANIYGQQQQLALAQQPNLGGVFQSIMPFMQSRSSSGNNGKLVYEDGRAGFAPGTFPRVKVVYGT